MSPFQEKLYAGKIKTANHWQEVFVRERTGKNGISKKNLLRKL
jgi:hypothetical protein